MCGIAGILSHDGAPDMARRAALMERALSHRGPDSHAVWASRHCHAAFAHAPGDHHPTPSGRQPMSIDDGRLTITFNGEIYNFMESAASSERAVSHSRAR
jgi:asparagine synthase (glutamine-hydrolysing)